MTLMTNNNYNITKDYFDINFFNYLVNASKKYIVRISHGICVFFLLVNCVSLVTEALILNEEKLKRAPY